MVIGIRLFNAENDAEQQLSEETEVPLNIVTLLLILNYVLHP